MKSEVEMRRHRVVKTARTLVRLKHSLAADEELNLLLPPTLAEFDEATSRGKKLDLQIDIHDLLGR